VKKIPTLFRRDPEDMRKVTREVHPDCQWVLDGEGAPTRKYDGTCVMFDGQNWWARREVKPGKPAPAEFRAEQTDELTGKTVGWEPMAQSSFAKYHAAAIANEAIMDHPHWGQPQQGATYELIGPKVNGNPEEVDEHILVRHGYWAAVDAEETRRLELDFDGLLRWLLAHPRWEGIVWHHPDGRMAKLKWRDATATVGGESA
jgi:hypothetical protein